MTLMGSYVCIIMHTEVNLMYIQKRSNNWNDELVLVLDVHIGDTGEIIPANVYTIFRLSIDEIGNLYDQLVPHGESLAASIRLKIKGRQCIFPYRMAAELYRIVVEVGFDYEISQQMGDHTEYLPIEEWTEEYLLSLPSTSPV